MEFKKIMADYRHIVEAWVSLASVNEDPVLNGRAMSAVEDLAEACAQTIVDWVEETIADHPQFIEWEEYSEPRFWVWEILPCLDIYFKIPEDYPVKIIEEATGLVFCDDGKTVIAGGYEDLIKTLD